MKRFVPLLLVAVSLNAPAQDSMWVANRFSSDLHQVSACGEILNVVSVGTSVRRVKQAPDGKLWVIKFIQSTIAVLDPDGTNLQNIPTSLGNAFDVAFDSNGHAWVSGGGGVEEFDANGVSVATYPLPAAAPLGITVDVLGNKWIAHRVGPPGSVSRIDGVTGAITNYSLLGTSNIQPVAIVADTRMLGLDSHIWVVGDGGNSLAEFDIAGTALNNYSIGVGSGLGSIMVDAAGDIWIGNFSTGAFHQVNPTTGTIINSYTNSPSVVGVNFDSFGRLWLSTRVSFSGPAPSEVRRYDPATGSLEVTAAIGLGTQSALSTRWHHALVVDSTADPDGDGEPSVIEILNGTSPYDAQSNSVASLLASGPTTLGSTLTLTVATDPSSVTGVAVATSLLPPPGLTLSGVAGTVMLDPSTLVFNTSPSPYFLTAMGFLAQPITIPMDPSLVGAVFHAQGLTTIMTGQQQVTNTTCVQIQ